ncbi:MAG: hypothetical protein K6G03_00180 [Lachnospiraceae bacterium]|nr:hypothetical protein [Lachnospiraceae bacterium]
MEINEFLEKYADLASKEEISTFFVDNEWFGEHLTLQDGRINLTQPQIDLFGTKLDYFTSHDENDLYKAFKASYPRTAKFFNEFVQEVGLDEESVFYITDFLYLRLQKDIVLYNDSEIETLLGQATFELTKADGDIFTYFLAYLRLKHKTVFKKDYILNRRYTMDMQNGAYSFDEYIRLLYCLFDEDFIIENEMFLKAAESKNYTDTWLYLALHFVRPLRLTDMERIYHPDLPCPPEEVIERVKNDTFSDNDARHVLLTITKRMNWLSLTPNKTAETSGVVPISFDIPVSCEVFFGKLFALAEAHRMLIGEEDTPIIRKISTYQEINRYMGEEIGELFLYSDFRSRSATKSFLQDIYMVANEDETDSGLHIKGYYLASLARSHKGSYEKFASTTFEYLKDAKFNNLSAEFVAFELLERGVFSFIKSLLLKMVAGEDFDNLSPEDQTSIIKILDLTPKETESVVSIVDTAFDRAKSTVLSLISNETDIVNVLHRIGSGEAFSKQRECLCLMSAVEKLCPFPDRRSCIGCSYEISTRSTFFLLIEEYNRIKGLYLNTEAKLEKTKYKYLLTSVVIPKLDEMLSVIRESYGEEVFKDYESLIKENT